MLTFKDLSKNKEYLNENNNCVVIALNEVTSSDFDFETVDLFVKHVMNRPKNGTVFYNEIEKSKKMFKNIGLNYKKIKVVAGETIESFHLKNEKGSFLLIVDGHMMSMIDSCIHDMYFNANQKIISAIKVSY